MVRDTLASEFSNKFYVFYVILIIIDSKSSVFTDQEKATIKQMKASSVGAVSNRSLGALVKDLALEEEGANLSKLDEEGDRPEWMTNCPSIYYEVKEIAETEDEKRSRQSQGKDQNRSSIIFVGKTTNNGSTTIT